MPERIKKIFGPEFYHGILGMDIAEANSEFSHQARKRLVKYKCDYYVGVYLTERGLDEMADEGRLPIFLSIATRTAAKYEKGAIAKLLKDVMKNTVSALHSHGIEAEWSGSINSPIYVEDFIDIEESTYEKGTRIFQSWYVESLLDSGKDMGENEVVTRLLVELLQKLALSGLDPWLLDMKQVMKKFGLGVDDPITERDVRLMLADVEPKVES
jgi:hypothetical protein